MIKISKNIFNIFSLKMLFLALYYINYQLLVIMYDYYFVLNKIQMKIKSILKNIKLAMKNEK